MHEQSNDGAVPDDGLNDRDIVPMKEGFSPRLEFYQDRSGVTGYADNIAIFEKNFKAPARTTPCTSGSTGSATSRRESRRAAACTAFQWCGRATAGGGSCCGCSATITEAAHRAIT